MYGKQSNMTRTCFIFVNTIHVELVSFPDQYDAMFIYRIMYKIAGVSKLNLPVIRTGN